MGGWHELAIAWLVHRSREVAADRGQSQVIGAILIFGFVIAGLGLYQVTVVPQQTGEVELQHSEAVKDDFSEVHGAIVESGSTNDLRTASVKLGTRYPPRALTLNPSPVSGRISAEDIGGDIEFENSGFGPSGVCDSSPVEPKTLTYEADYNQLGGSGSHGYETSVTYHKVGENIVSSNQVLIQGTSIRLLPLTTGSVSKSSIKSETLEFEGGQTGGTAANGPLKLKIPTKLTAEQWKTILTAEDKVKKDQISKSGGRVIIPLDSGSYTVSCTPVGEGKAPENNPDLVPTSGSSPSGIGINPSGQGEVVLISTSSVSGGGSEEVDVELEYKPSSETGAGGAEMVGARFNYLYTGGPGYSGEGSSDLVISNNSASLDIGGNYVEFTSDSTTPDTISISQSGTDIDFEFDDKITAQHYYVATFAYEYPNGATETSTYFISHPKS